MMHHVAEAIDHKSFYSLINSQSQLCAAGKLQNRKGPATKQNFSRKNNCFTIVSSWKSSQFREKKIASSVGWAEQLLDKICTGWAITML